MVFLLDCYKVYIPEVDAVYSRAKQDLTFDEARYPFREDKKDDSEELEVEEDEDLPSHPPRVSFD